MARVLLTGARGFIGRHCHRLLSDDGWEVHAVASREPDRNTAAKGDSTVWHIGNLLDREQMRRIVAEARPSHLLHLAWYTVRGDLYQSAENERWVAAGLELLEAVGEQGARRAVMAGTCAEYDWSGGRCSEDETPLAPVSPYGAAKNELRRSFEAWADREGRSGAWARLFFLYGPGEHPQRLVPYVIRSLLAGQTAECTHGRQQRDYLYVVDAAEALVRLLGSSVNGAINVGSGRAVPVSRVILEAAEQLGRTELVRLGARPVPEGEAPLVEAVVTRLNRELGFTATTGLEGGIARTIAWWRRELSATEPTDQAR